MDLQTGGINFQAGGIHSRWDELRPAAGGMNQKPEVKAGDWNCSSCGDHQFAKNTHCRKCGAAREIPAGQEPTGDWHCPNCNDLQFARNTNCRKCGTANPDPGAAGKGAGKTKLPGDWYCTMCGDLQFARNTHCRKCNTPNVSEITNFMAGVFGGGAKGQGRGVQQQKAVSRKPGDWDCLNCGSMQFAKNVQCRDCGEPNPDVEGSRAAMQAGIANNANIYESREGDWYCPKCGDLQFAKNRQCRKCGEKNPDPAAQPVPGSMLRALPAFHGHGAAGAAEKPGDWYCNNCGDLQFARNLQCRKCGTMNQQIVEGGPLALMQAIIAGAAGMSNAASHAKPLGPPQHAKKPGDWNCPSCRMLNFARNESCRSCSTPNPDPQGSLAAFQEGIAAGHGGHEEKPGDWYCPSCNDLQFARNKQCRKCGAANPDPEGSMAAAQAAGAKLGGWESSSQRASLPGDWNCPACGDLQFARNTTCRKCGTPNPQGSGGFSFGVGQKRPFPGAGFGGGGGVEAAMKRFVTHALK
eukprot:TRINITY_DN30643_c0_g1_i1.p1 TRINITY_DN30643_c0_g1~~TRINITY_DN30643_c0_g1_i1.p1  ORF type:complete len:523 (+),score=87.49 TRINITY_DN30643_c0_g1_i1:72-1640(+)